MLWLQSIPVVLVGTLVVFVPGLLPLVVLRVRGLALLALAPVVGTAVVAGSAILLDWLGLPWAPLPFLGVVVVVTLLALALRWILRPSPSPAIGEGRRWLIPAALFGGTLLGAWSLISYIGDPEGISQTNDAVFHFNAIRFAIETASASSLHISSFTGASGFYPAAWHGVVSLLVLVTGADIALAVNAVTLIIGAAIWPLGIAWFAKVITGSTAVAGYAAVLSGALQMFPLLMVQWGVLYPNALSIAVLPAAIALVVSVPPWWARSRTARTAVFLGILLAVTFVALLLSQPASVLAWGLISAVWFTFWILRQRSVPAVLVRVIIAAVPWLILGAVWWFFARSTSGSHWPTFRGRLEAVLDVVLNGQMTISDAVGVSILMLIGLAVAIRRVEHRWIAVAWLAISALYIASAAIGSADVRAWLLGPWYADPNRLAALAPVLVIPLAAMGADALVRLGAHLITRTGRPMPKVGDIVGFAGVVAFMLVVLIVRPTGVPAFAGEAAHPESRYLMTQDSYLSLDERDLLESLPLHVPEGERVISNPSTGAGFGYALSGVDVYPRSWAPPTSVAWATVAAGLRYAATDNAVCEALDALGDPGYVLDFGAGEVAPGRYVYPAMTDFAGQAGFELVAEEEDSSLWKITACER